MKSCCDEYCSNYGCNQGRDCPVRESIYGTPYKPTGLDVVIVAVAVVFAVSCIGYLVLR
jgi:hypothetical protein